MVLCYYCKLKTSSLPQMIKTREGKAESVKIYDLSENIDMFPR